jgi:hypothetical protein
MPLSANSISLKKPQGEDFEIFVDGEESNGNSSQKRKQPESIPTSWNYLPTQKEVSKENTGPVTTWNKPLQHKVGNSNKKLKEEAPFEIYVDEEAARL